jgi:hypothetical protein
MLAWLGTSLIMFGVGPLTAIRLVSGVSRSRDACDDGFGRISPGRGSGLGAAVVVVSGVAWEGGFHTTPDSLRAGPGVPDAEFDAFIPTHQEVQTWYAAWSGAGAG